MSDKIEQFGATVRGPRNRREGRANQDAWSRTRGSFGHLITVCDGLGSCSQGRLGAQAACRAVHRAIRLWPGVLSGAEPTHLMRLVEILWLLEVAPNSPSDCATTCAFAVREPTGQVLVAGLGDGLAAIRRADGSVVTVGGRDVKGFGNETLALGSSHRIADWWMTMESPGNVRTVVLASDGVADDLDPSRTIAFVEWLEMEIGNLEPSVRWRQLCQELREWPVPHHVDDKTIAVLRMSMEATQ